MVARGTLEGTPLIKARFVRDIREVLKTIGLPQGQYAGHSFKIGAATAVAQVGVEDFTIQIFGRWQSAAFLQYIRMPKEKLEAVSSLLVPRAGTSVSQREQASQQQSPTILEPLPCCLIIKHVITVAGQKGIHGRHNSLGQVEGEQRAR